MGSEHHSESSGAGVVIAIGVVLFLLLVGGIGAAGVWLARSSAQTEAMMAMQRDALAREAAARAMAEGAASAALTSESAGMPQLVTIKIDSEGDIRLDDEPAPFADLRTRLDAVRSEANSNVEVLIQVDERCTTASLLGVIQVCNDVGLGNVRVAPLGEPVDVSADERNSPTTER